MNLLSSLSSVQQPYTDSATSLSDSSFVLLKQPILLISKLEVLHDAFHMLLASVRYLTFNRLIFTSSFDHNIIFYLLLSGFYSGIGIFKRSTNLYK